MVEGEISTMMPNWLDLPRDLTTNILQRLDTLDIITRACKVCPLWWNICKDPVVSRTLRMTYAFYSYDYNLDKMKFCRHAVEQSCGHLKHIDIQQHCSDELLEFIAENAGNLQCLRLAYSCKISDNVFIKAVKNFPLLVEVDISFCNLSKKSLEVLGRSCHYLKSLKFETMRARHIGCLDNEAFVIAETMSGLCRLNIKGNVLTNVGLLAILDGCPLLESLNIQGCYNLRLSESIRKRCCEQLKDYTFDDHYPSSILMNWYPISSWI